MNSVKRSFPFWVPLLFGLMGLSREIGNPRLQSVRVVDILQITATGMCLGAALVAFVYFLRDRRRAR
jgi:hypothetical protein